jgi:hypothetical protein
LLFHTAVARCGFGHLRALDVSRFFASSEDTLETVLRLNAGSLQQLRVCNGIEYDCNKDDDANWVLGEESTETLLEAAPRLPCLEVDVHLEHDMEKFQRMLRRTPPYTPLRVRGLRFDFPQNADVATLMELTAEVSACDTITDLYLDEAPLRTPAALTAVVNAALVSRLLTSLALVNCSLCAASVPALVRLLAGGPLRTLFISNGRRQLLDAPAATLLADSLRANTTLTKLGFIGCDLWRSKDAARTLLSALTGHASIQTLCLKGNKVRDGQCIAVGQAVSNVLSANAAALEVLSLDATPHGPHGLGDDGTALLLVGLAHNTHLRLLDVSHNRISPEFARNVLLPAANAHPALRQLKVKERSFDASETFDSKP